MLIYQLFNTKIGGKIDVYILGLGGGLDIDEI